MEKWIGSEVLPYAGEWREEEEDEWVDLKRVGVVFE